MPSFVWSDKAAVDMLAPPMAVGSNVVATSSSLESSISFVRFGVGSVVILVDDPRFGIDEVNPSWPGSIVLVSSSPSSAFTSCEVISTF